MPCAGSNQTSLFSINVGELGGDEHVHTRKLFEEQPVYARQQGCRLMRELRRGSEHGAEDGSEHCSRNAFAHDVGYDEELFLLTNTKDVIEVTANLMRATA